MIKIISDGFINLLRHVVEGATAVLFASFSIVILVQVFYRYVLNDSLFWAEEFSRLAFFGVLMLSMPMICDRKAHIVMDLLEATLKPRSRQVLEKVNAIITIGFLAIFGWYGIELAGKSQYMSTTATGISMMYIYALVPVAAFISIIFIVNNWSSSRRQEHE